MAEPRPELDITQRILAWYGENARDLPWRARPGEQPDAYRVWLSEIMLQQTTVAAVREYFLKFTRLWPDVESLAAAPLDDVLRAWAGLGYYARARNLHACARKVTHEFGGRFPETEASLRQLPGIGDYTAGAIAAIAFGVPAVAIDGNVERVISRLFAIETPLPAAKTEIRRRTLALLPPHNPGDFAQALMDLGATICTPKRLNCLICPLVDCCEGRKSGVAERLPNKVPKKPIPIRRGVAFWVENQDGAILLRRRPEKGLLGGMVEIPSTEWNAGLPQEVKPPIHAKWQRKAGNITHTFTHFHLELEIWRSASAIDSPPPESMFWIPRKEIHAQALPSVMRKIVDAMLG